MLLIVIAIFIMLMGAVFLFSAIIMGTNIKRTRTPRARQLLVRRCRNTGILSGGRYDRLLQKMGRSSSAIGFAIYLDLLERFQPQTNGFDVVLLYDPSEDAATVLSAAEKLREKGSVLICSCLPESNIWRLLYRILEGEAVLIEDNG